MNETFGSILQRRVSRRGVLQAGALLGSALALPAEAARSGADAVRLTFRSITGSRADAVRVPDGYSAAVLVGWGDPLWPDASSLDTRGLARGALLEPGAAAAQERQFGYNCDAIAFFALDREGRRGLLCVNHEYTNDELMFPGRIGLGREGAAALTEWCRRHPEAARVSLAAHGASVLEVELQRSAWRVRRDSRYTRRLTGTTPIELTGPARGHALLRTAADPTGTRVLGMLGNCAGGKTPWGTYLTAEENIQDYFGGYQAWRRDSAANAAVRDAHRRFPLQQLSHHGWEHTTPRFDVGREPAEALRFGWIVEIDPRDPAAPVRKRTALGRMAHEGATCAIARDGRVAVYTGDDKEFEYLYKFVTRDRCDLARPQANRDLLDHGTLHVARFAADGSGEWLPLVHGSGPLTATAGFADAGEVLHQGASSGGPARRYADGPARGRRGASAHRSRLRGVHQESATCGGRAATRIQRPPARRRRGCGQPPRCERVRAHPRDRGARWRCGRDPLPLERVPARRRPGRPDARFLSEASRLRPGELAARDTYFAGAAAAAASGADRLPRQPGFRSGGPPVDRHRRRATAR